MHTTDLLMRSLESRSLWLALGFAGQVLFAGRFLLQWIHSERMRRSEVPLGFWFLSLAGGLILLIYAIHIADPVFILGQAFGALIYLRNLQLIFRERRHRARA